MRAIGSFFFALVLVLVLVLAMPGPLLAADNSGPLAPGKPAGVRQAQDNHELENILVGVSAVIAVGLGVILIKKYTKTSAVAPAATTGTSSAASATSS